MRARRRRTVLKTDLRGCYVATLTPFDQSDRVDAGVIAAHAQWLIAEGVEGLCPAGTTGEFLYLSENEKRLVVKSTVAAANGAIPVIAGIWALRREETLRLAKAAEDDGATGVFLPPPIYYPSGDDAIFDYYSDVKTATNLPLFAYNIPQYASNEVSFECLHRLFHDGVIAGVKDSTGKEERVKGLIQRFGSVGTMFAASDGFVSKGRELGADGFISAIGNATPSLFARLWQGEVSLQQRATELRTGLKRFGSIAALKFLLTLKGFPFGESRLPYSTLSENDKAALKTIDL